MNAAEVDDDIVIKMTKDEVLIFFDWICRFNSNKENDKYLDEAERNILFCVEAVLEKNIPEVFRNDYKLLIKKAKESIINST